MLSFFTKKSNLIILTVVAIVIGYGNSGSHPTTGNGGYTGAPGDGLCTQCHGGTNNALSGSVTIDGLPSTVVAGDTYTLTVTINSSNANAIKGGFQMLILNGANQNAGTLSNPSTFTSLTALGNGKVYFGHQPAQNFAGQSSMSYTVDWQAPSTVGNNPIIKFNASALLTNGNGSTSGDRMFLYGTQLPIVAGSAQLTASISNVENISCFNSNDGSATVTASGGTSPYSYLWTNGVTTATNTTLGPGSASVTVTDNNNATASAITTIIEPPLLSATIDFDLLNPCPNASVAIIEIYHSGGTPSFSYLWSNGVTTKINSNLPNGIYFCTVTDSNGCTSSSSLEVTSGPGVNVNLLLLNNITCNGLTNGQISVVGAGIPNTAYTYLWSNSATTSQINNLAAGSYTVTVSASGTVCTSTGTYGIIEPTTIALNDFIAQEISCHNSTDGSIAVQPTGGTAPFSILWSNGAVSSVNQNLAPGTYTVTVTDQRGCTATKSFELSAPDSISINIVNSMNASCNGAMNGSILLSASGGIQPFSYLWSNGNNSNLLNDVSAGIYSVTVSDSKNCQKTASYTVGTNSSFMIGTPTVTDITCGGDSIGLIILPTVSGFVYNWSNGRTGAILDSLKAGIYSVIATDSNNCQSIPLSISVKENPRLKSSLVAADTLLCPREVNGFLDTELSGGIGKLKFKWNTGDTTNLKLENLVAGLYQNRVVDSLGCVDTFRYAVIAIPDINVDTAFIISPTCFGSNNGQLSLGLTGGYKDFRYNWSNGATTDTLRRVRAGTYIVTISDSNNCSIIDTVSVAQPDSIIVNLLITNETLAGAMDGSVVLTATGGTAPYDVVWASGQTGFEIDGLVPGVYRYILTDSKGCTRAGIAVVGGGECSFTFDYTKTDPTCFNSFDGAIILNLPSASSDYNIDLIKGNNIITADLNKLDAGTYTVIVTDNLNCVFVQENIILQSTNPAIVLDSLLVVKPKGAAGKDGRLEIIVSGGVTPFTYTWTKNGDVVGIKNFVDGLGVGIYRVAVTDAAGCMLLVRDIQLEGASAVEDLLVGHLELYPNPVSKIIHIRSDYSHVIKSVQLFDNKGQSIGSKILVSASEAHVDLDAIGQVQNGVYLLKIEVNDEILIKKIIVLRD